MCDRDELSKRRVLRLHELRRRGLVGLRNVRGMPDDMWRVCDVLWLITEHSVATDSDTDHDTGTCDTCADHDTRTGHSGSDRDTGTFDTGSVGICGRFHWGGRGLRHLDRHLAQRELGSDICL